MPVLTKDQVLEAVWELPEDAREEVVAQLTSSLQLPKEHKQIIRDEIEAHRRDPSTAISRDQLMAKMQAAQ